MDGQVSQAYSISSDGTLVFGGSNHAASFTPFPATVAAWQGPLFAAPIDLSGPNADNVCYGVNKSASVFTGGASYQGYATPEIGWIWSGIYSGLGTLPGFDWSCGLGISGDGNTVVGQSGDTISGDVNAFVWTAETGIVALAHKSDVVYSTAQAVNGDGSVIVGYCQNATEYYGFTATAKGISIPLPNLPGGNFSFATGVDNSGLFVVGNGTDTNNVGVAIVWQNLPDYMPPTALPFGACFPCNPIASGCR